MSEKAEDWKLRILHIQRELVNIENFYRENLHDDILRIYALVRSFQIIGEAAKKIPDDIKARYSTIPWRQMAGFRDVLVHDYDDVDIDILKNIVEKELPTLKNEFKKIELSEDDLNN